MMTREEFDAWQLPILRETQAGLMKQGYRSAAITAPFTSKDLDGLWHNYLMQNSEDTNVIPKKE